MKKLLLASVAMLALGAGAPAIAQTTVTTDADTNAAVGATGAGAGGAAVGFILGGPIGAVIGGFTGAVIGAEAGVAASTVEFAGNNPVEPIFIEGDLDVGVALPETVTIYPVEGDAQYGYVYANGRVWIVNIADRTLVQSPGFLVAQSSADFAVSNPVDPIEVEGDVVVGYVVPDTVELVPIPEDRTYSYVYVDGRPALVDNSSRTIVWVNQ